MTTSRLAAVIAALFTAFDATDAIAAYRGVPILSDAPADFVIVGGRDDANYMAGATVQDWNGLGARTRVEEGRVVCAIIAQSGDDDLAGQQDRAHAVLAQVEDVLRADPTLGGIVSSGWLQVLDTLLEQRSTGAGTYARLTVTIGYQAHI